MTWKFVLAFSLLWLGAAMGMCVHNLVAGPSAAKMEIPLILLLAGLLGSFVGVVLRDLTKRVEKLEAGGSAASAKDPD